MAIINVILAAYEAALSAALVAVALVAVALVGLVAYAAWCQISWLLWGRARWEAEQAAEEAARRQEAARQAEEAGREAQETARRQKKDAEEAARRQKLNNARIRELGDEACSNFRAYNAWCSDRTARKVNDFIREDRRASACLARAKRLVNEMKEYGWVNPTAGSRWGELNDNEYICQNFGPRV
jgi:hypothetical protein